MASIPVMLFVGLFTFSLLYLTPGDPAAIVLGDNASLDELERIREKLGLNEAFHIRFGKWLGTVLRGDLGESLFTNYKVTDLIWARVQPTVSLAVLSLLLAIGSGVPLGILAAYKANTWIDHFVMLVAVLGIAVPAFVMGFLIMWLFVFKFRILPVSGFTPITEGFGDFMKHLIMPSVTIAVAFMALIARMTRASMMEVLQEDYIRTARAKGLGDSLVLFRHALK